MRIFMPVLFVLVVIFIVVLGVVNFLGMDSLQSTEAQSYFLKVHIITAFLAYGSFAFSFLVGLIYLFQDWQLKKRLLSQIFHRLPSLEIMERWIFRGLLFGLPMLTLALVSGFVWMNSEFGTFWIWNSKVISSVFAWVVYSFLFYFHFISALHGRKVIFLSVFAFVTILIVFLGMNLFESQIREYLTIN